ncbi:MAG: CapA family protein [Rectinemataceae bacterium]
MADAKVKLSCWLYGRTHRREFGASRALEGNLPYMGPDERYWWGYKYYCGPIEKAEPGSGLEEFFRAQDLDFSLGEDFVETAAMTLSVGGDILASPHLRPETTTALWNDVREFYFGADLVYANLETPIVPSAPPSFVPKSILEETTLNNTPEMFDRAVYGRKGVNFFSTANNHCLDQGEKGLRETLDFLDAKGYPHVGTARSPEERDAVVMIEKGGVKAAFVSFTFGLNGKGLPEGKEYLVNYVRLNKPDADISPIATQVAAARAAGADVVVALLHWSLEFESYPVRNVVDMGHKLLRLGIDVIIGNHPHNVQPIEKYSYTDGATGALKIGLIIYALGDLLSVHKTLPNSRLASLARIRISKGRAGGKECARVSGLEILPTYLYVKKERDVCEDYRVLDFRKLSEELHAGKNRLGLSRAKVREAFRLEALMNKVLHAALKKGEVASR